MLNPQRWADNYDTFSTAILLIYDITLCGQVRGDGLEQRDFRESWWVAREMAQALWPLGSFPSLQPSIAILKSCKLWQPFVTLRTYLPKAKGYFVCVRSTQAFLYTAFYFCWDFLANCTWIHPYCRSAMECCARTKRSSHLLGCCLSLIREYVLQCWTL
jgi:hypothetical protein